MKSVKYLEKLQKKEKLNDTELAKLLGITQPSISNLKAGRRVMDDETCLAIALKLGINPLEVVGAACVDRAEKTGQKSLWEVFMSRMETTVASTILCAVFVTLFLTPPTANAATAGLAEGSCQTIYKLCEIKDVLGLQCIFIEMFFAFLPSPSYIKAWGKQLKQNNSLRIFPKDGFIKMVNWHFSCDFST